MRLPLLVMLFLSQACGAHNSWSSRDVALESAMMGMIAIDYVQTQNVTKECEEDNPILGKCGEKMNSKLYMVGAAIAHILVAHVLNDDARTGFQTVSLGVEGHVIFRNWKNGRGPDL